MKCAALLGAKTLSITAHSIKDLHRTLSINQTKHINAPAVELGVVMLGVAFYKFFMLSVVAPFLAFGREVYCHSVVDSGSLMFFILVSKIFFALNKLVHSILWSLPDAANDLGYGGFRIPISGTDFELS